MQNRIAKLSVAISCIVLLGILIPGCAMSSSQDSSRPRLIILADMGNEPDEEQQMVHMLVNSNEFELEGLIAVTGIFLNEKHSKPEKQVVHPELFHKLIDGYAKVVDNLRLHADGWPAPESPLDFRIRRGAQSIVRLASILGPGIPTRSRS